MSSRPLFRRHYFISVAVIGIGLLISVAVSFVVSAIERDLTFRPPMDYFRQIIVSSDQQPVDVIRKLNADRGPFSFEYLEPTNALERLNEEERRELQSGQSVMHRIGWWWSSSREFYISLGEGQGTLLLKNLMDGRGGGPSIFGGPPRPPPPGERPPGMMPLPPGELGMGPPPGEPGFAPGLKEFSRGQMPPLPPRRFWGAFPLIVILICLFIGMMVTVGIAISMLFSSYKSRARTAQDVLAQLKAGNLSARLPLHSMDELADLVVSFNLMADEIEKLVGRIRQSEAGRMQTLQRLAHDLRTPLASMKTFLETLRDERSRMNETQIQRSVELCLAEEIYFERLVEDLLTLATVADPVSPDNAEPVRLVEQTERQVEAFRGRHPDLKISLEVDESAQQAPPLKGSRWLIERLIRNGLDNAAAFSKDHVRVQLSCEKGRHLLVVSDDGPGLTDEALAEFGHLRKTRRVESQTGLKLSLGMGSVIMREIAGRHDGEVRITNREGGGARLEISLGRPG